MSMSEARKLKVEPQLNLALIDIHYSVETAKIVAEELASETKVAKAYLRKLAKHYEKGRAKYKELYGREWTIPKA